MISVVQNVHSGNGKLEAQRFAVSPFLFLSYQTDVEDGGDFSLSRRYMPGDEAGISRSSLKRPPGAAAGSQA